MARTLTRSVVLSASALLILTNLCLAGTGAQKRKAAAKPDQTPPAAQQLVPVPLQAPTPEQMPAQPPHVTFQNGLLAISADNSNLADVLRGVRSALGIGLDTPPGAGSERVVVHLGPGQPRDILTQLLNGSRYDYILVGAAQDPQGISQVILTPRQSTAVAGNVGQPPPPQPAVGGASHSGRRRFGHRRYGSTARTLCCSAIAPVQSVPARHFVPTCECSEQWRRDWRPAGQDA